MNHNELRDSLWDLFDDDLTPQRRTELQAHLQSCAECLRDFTRIERTRGLLFRPSAPPSPADTELFVQRVMAKLPESSANGAWWRLLDAPWTIPALSLGLAAACLSILLSPPESIAPSDTLMLLNPQSRSVAQWILPPDQSNGSDPLAFTAEEIQ